MDAGFLQGDLEVLPIELGVEATVRRGANIGHGGDRVRAQENHELFHRMVGVADRVAAGQYRRWPPNSAWYRLANDSNKLIPAVANLAVPLLDGLETNAPADGSIEVMKRLWPPRRIVSPSPASARPRNLPVRSS